MMPCYNGARTLPLALASLLAQTYPHWECVLVDDGSTDAPERVVECVNDPRIRLHRLEKNMGRGYARQVALDLADGDYMAFLDADDWIYPDKLARQVALLEARSEVCAVSMSMTVVDFLGHPAGVRRLTALGAGTVVDGPMVSPRPPTAAFAPTMVRMDVAKTGRFDSALRLAQDTDYLLQILMERRFCLMEDAGYVYTELASRNPKKAMAGYRYSQQIYRKYLSGHALASGKQIALYEAKHTLMGVCDAIGLGGALLSRKLPGPTYEERRAFGAAKTRVYGISGEIERDLGKGEG